MLVRQKFRGKALLNALIDLPFAISPVVIGLALILVYGRATAGSAARSATHGIQIIFSVPGMILATIFVSLPFVVREVMPVLQEIGTDQEQAAETLGRHALADILAGDAAVDPLGRHLRRRARHGARAGRVRRGQRRLREDLSGETETLPLFVENGFENFNHRGRLRGGDRARGPRARRPLQHELPPAAVARSPTSTE